MQKEKIPWQNGAVLICTKCHQLLNTEDQPTGANCGEQLKNELKENLRQEGYGKSVRVMNVGCLGVCIPEVQAVAYLPNQVEGEIINRLPEQTEVLTIKPSQEKEEFFNWVKAKLKK